MRQLNKNPARRPHQIAIAGGGTVRAVDRALALLELFAEDEEGYRLSDLADRSGLSPSTIHRLLTTLEQRNFVQFNQASGIWYIGRRSFYVGSAFVRRRNVLAQAIPFLRELRDETRETANIGIACDGEVVLLAQIESREIIRVIARTGGQAPMTSSGLGKAILATYNEKDIA